jgi:hypothetical protein
VTVTAAAARQAEIRPGQVWRMPKSSVGRTILVTSVGKTWVYYDLITGAGPPKRRVTVRSLLASYVPLPPEPRPLTTDERIQARHLLQVLSERARAARNAIEPYTGIARYTDQTWYVQVEELTRDLEVFTAQVRQGRPAHPYNTGDRSA